MGVEKKWENGVLDLRWSRLKEKKQVKQLCSLSLKCVWWWASGPSLAENTPFSWIIFPRNRSIATFDCRRGTSLYIPWIFHYTPIKPPFVLLNHPLLWVAKNIDALFPTGWLINREQYCIQLPFPFIFQYIPIIIPLYPHQATFLAIVRSRYITIFTGGSPSSSIWTEPHVGQPAQPVTLGPSGWRFSLDLHVPGQERHLRCGLHEIWAPLEMNLLKNVGTHMIS